MNKSSVSTVNSLPSPSDPLAGTDVDLPDAPDVQSSPRRVSPDVMIRLSERHLSRFNSRREASERCMHDRCQAEFEL